MTIRLVLLASSLVFAGVVGSGSALADTHDPRWQPPTEGFTLVAQIIYTDKGALADDYRLTTGCELIGDGGKGFKCPSSEGYRKVAIQQWESKSANEVILRIFSPNADFENEPNWYRRTYRVYKQVKPKVTFWVYDYAAVATDPWTYWGPSRPDYKPEPGEEKILVPVPKKSKGLPYWDHGIDLRFDRDDFFNGNYTTLYSVKSVTKGQWRCSIYFYDVCRWDDKDTIFEWTAYMFDVRKKKIAKFRERSWTAFSGQQFEKQIQRVLLR